MTREKTRSYLLSLPLLLLLSSLFWVSGCSQKRGVYHSGSHTSKARHRATMRRYTVRGKCYTPTYVEVGQTMRGISSWYGPNFHGKQTSNGEIYNMYARTAAHKTWPMDTMVKVTNLDNGRQTVVRINDRGPFVKGRIIDCSYLAGKELGLDKTGIARVKLEVVGFAGQRVPDAVIAQQKRAHRQKRVRLSNFGVQVGAFRRYAGAEIYRKRYASFDPKYHPVIRKFSDVNGMPLYRVWLMGFGSEEEARDFKARHAMPGAFIVRN
jgi:rare lipoprotein A